MGRPRQYDENTAAALLDSAEQLISEGGLERVSLRRLAAMTGVTVQAVYSLFGSKEGLVAALGTRAFNLLRDGLDSLPVSDDPAGDLVEGGAVVFRRFTLSHPALFMIGVLRTSVPAEIAREFRGAQKEALARLHLRIGRLKKAGRLGARAEPQAAMEFHALCEGLASLEGRKVLHRDEAEKIWRDALQSLVRGWAMTG
jgi:AcrR family transcriptional regulator